MKRISICFLTIVFLIAGTAVLFGEDKKTDAKALFESKCSVCHSIDRPKSKKKTKEAWESTVMRMKNVNNCPITDEEAKIIIDYLAENYGQ
ncbi:MAG: photosystem P840 reaction-center cytochrome c-551 [Nitrospiraceae bacterium]|jgi:cytochrome c5|nr:MAG: photosystem P840 reaction-center cytochrome c-551 [Nitrospiraceae bacterium]